MAEGSAAPRAQEHWSSRFAFLMAAIGSAVGLGNLWRFPFQTGSYGGAIFVFVYLMCVIFIAFPVLVAELSVGRHKGLSAVGSTRNLAIDAGRSPRWAIAGWVGMTAGFLILTTYSLIAGQVMAYSAMSFLGEFTEAARAAGGAALPLYDTVSDQILWHTAFMVITVIIVARGLTGGIEKVVTILMPLFFIMLGGLCVYALATGDAGAAIAYLFKPDFSAIREDMVLAALGQAFFSIGVGAAIMITYGSYLSRDEHIPASARIIAGADTLVALVAGLMIFPIVFAFGLDPGAGMGLIFDALPRVFSGMPAGPVVGGAFFFLAFIAALTSSISLLQVVAAFAEEHTDLSKTTAMIIFGALAWLVGVGAAFSADFGGFVDDAVGLIILPMGGLLITVFAGWVVPEPVMRGELPHASDLFFKVWRFMLRYAVPIAVGYIIVRGLDEHFGISSRYLGGG
jgi:NSS family neurotransmitter:Na+ symporter